MKDSERAKLVQEIADELERRQIVKLLGEPPPIQYIPVWPNTTPMPYWQNPTITFTVTTAFVPDVIGVTPVSDEPPHGHVRVNGFA